MKVINNLKNYRTLIKTLDKMGDNLKFLGKKEHIRKFEFIRKNTDLINITMPSKNKIVFNNDRIYAIEFIPSIDNYTSIIIQDETKEIYIKNIINFDNITLTETTYTLSLFNNVLSSTTDYKEYKCRFLNKQVTDTVRFFNGKNSKIKEEISYDSESQELVKTISDGEKNKTQKIEGSFNIPYSDIYHEDDFYYKDFNDVFEKNSYHHEVKRFLYCLNYTYSKLNKYRKNTKK